MLLASKVYSEMSHEQMFAFKMSNFKFQLPSMYALSNGSEAYVCYVYINLSASDVYFEMSYATLRLFPSKTFQVSLIAFCSLEIIYRKL